MANISNFSSNIIFYNIIFIMILTFGVGLMFVLTHLNFVEVQSSV